MSSENDIRQQFQEKFSDFKARVPADGWERLEEALNASPGVLVPRRPWRYAASAAAAVLLLIVGSLLFVQRPWDQGSTMLTDSTVKVPSTQVHSAKVTEPGDLTNNTGKATGTSAPVAVRTRNEALLITAARPHREETIGFAHPSEIAVDRSSRERVESVIAGINTRSLKAMITSLDRESSSEEILVAATGHDGLLAGSGRPDERKPVLLAISGRGGLTSYQQAVNTPMTLRSASTSMNPPDENTKNVFATQNTADNVSEMEHDQPVSFGITVSKEIVDDLYIETGLVYSYLYSKARNASANFEVQETQRLHYIGVPLNVNYNILSLNRFNIYASVGGMIEKDVHGDFRDIGEGETVANSRSERMEITPISQRNPQVSVNAGVGLSYPIYNRLRLYGKIGGAYYFDAKNEHKTIYSDRKIVMDLNVGLRYEF